MDDDWRVVVNTRLFTELGPEALRLASYAGSHLQLDPSAKRRPSYVFEPTTPRV